jgi:hypothetical protein
MLPRPQTNGVQLPDSPARQSDYTPRQRRAMQERRRGSGAVRATSLVPPRIAQPTSRQTAYSADGNGRRSPRGSGGRTSPLPAVRCRIPGSARACSRITATCPHRPARGLSSCRGLLPRLLTRTVLRRCQKGATPPTARGDRGRAPKRKRRGLAAVTAVDPVRRSRDRIRIHGSRLSGVGIHVPSVDQLFRRLLSGCVW